jgi:hypothetical protein
MKQQNMCFKNRYFQLPHEIEGKLPTMASDYIKNGSFYLFSHLAAPLEMRWKNAAQTLTDKVLDELLLASSLTCRGFHRYASHSAASAADDITNNED